MKCTIEQKTENNLLKRLEINGKLIFDKATPSNTDLKKELAGQLKSKEENVLVRNINTAFGESTATFSAYIYESPEALNTYTPTTKHIKEAAKKAAEEAKKKAEEAKAAAEKPAEEKKEEKPAEAKPAEEKPAEEKPAETKEPSAETAESPKEEGATPEKKE